MNRVIAHLSDLHFGRIDPATLDPLIAAVNGLKPDLIAVSGDLTQRARRKQFQQAREFLDRLQGPRIVVPGNHDVSLHNPWLRFVSKWSRFREHIVEETEQSYTDEALAVMGINTARALTWKGGRINRAQREAVGEFFCAAPAGALKVLVAHHPLDLPAGWASANRARRAKRAFKEWTACGVDMILAGHAHRACAVPGNHRAVIVQAGTATSTRGRGEPNSFNVIHVNVEEIRVERFTWLTERGLFERSQSDRFPRAFTPAP